MPHAAEYAAALDALISSARDDLSTSADPMSARRRLQKLWDEHAASFRRTYDPTEPVDWSDADPPEREPFLLAFAELCSVVGVEPKDAEVACRRSRCGLRPITGSELGDPPELAALAGALEGGVSHELEGVGTFSVRKGQPSTVRFQVQASFGDALNGTGEAQTPLARRLVAALSTEGCFASLKGIGELVVVVRPGRRGLNPVTKKPIEIPARRTVQFYASAVEGC